MRNYTMKTIAVLFLGLSVAFSAAAAEDGVWTCETPDNYKTKGSAVVEMVYDNPPNKLPVRVSYSKFGELINDSLWNCQNEEEWCEEKAKGLAEKFEAAGWSCSGG